MEQLIGQIIGYWWVAAALIAIGLYKQVLWLLGVIIIDDDSIGVVTKKFVLFGANKELPPNRIIALNGEAGYQADTLAPGLHWGFWPWQFDVETQKFFEVPEGHIGLVESVDGAPLPDGRIVGQEVACDNFQDVRAFIEQGGQRGPQMALLPPGQWRINPLIFKTEVRRMTVIESGTIGVVEAADGAPLEPGRVLARSVDCESFQNAKQFFTNGGQRGPQMSVITPGKYRINPYIFRISTAEVVRVPENKIGVVTTKEGNQLEPSEIAGEPVPNHDRYQNPMGFLQNNGKKGLQEEVLPSGTYFINPYFASVETHSLVEVPIAHAGVVIAFVGADGQDVTGDTFEHGNIVSRGQKGVWNEVLDPGKYPINPYTHKVSLVPTANVVLNWADAKTESHQLDDRLSTITVRSSDGFTFNLDVSQIIHIPRNQAPKVIARFGDMKALVTQVLEPMIGNYFRNAAQKSDVIDFLSKRTERQQEAKASIAAALNEYNVKAVETLIGDIVPPEDLMRTLTERKIAQQEQITFKTQQQSEEARQSLEQSRALADTQRSVVDAERGVAIADYRREAAIKTAQGEAESMSIRGEAEAKVIRAVGSAEADKTYQIGNSDARVFQEKISSVGAHNFALMELFKSISSGQIKIVPDVMVSGQQGGTSGLSDVLVGQLLAQNFQKPTTPKSSDSSDGKQASTDA
jgi:uncharacterized membrane protein YqiK